jgi:hypothetical protein
MVSKIPHPSLSPIAVLEFEKTGMFKQILPELPNKKCHVNPFCRSRAIRAQMGGDTREAEAGRREF